MAEIEEGEVVLCTVDRIMGTVVFVKIDSYGGKEGSIIMSEIAPGRIRNIREYVVPKKKIVCKVLRISSNGNINLSLRRVTQKEKKEVIEKHNQEKSYISVLKSILGEKSSETIKKISEKENLYDFLEEAKENPKKLEKIVGTQNSKKIIDILKTQKEKNAIIKKNFSLQTKKPNGLNLIKNLLSKFKDAEIKYLSSGKYSLKIESPNPKTADQKIKEIFKEIENNSKKEGLEFETTEK